jgi:hypothetical protein
VTFGRQITGATAGSGVEKLTTDGSSAGSQLSVAAPGVNGAPYQSNLRIRDSATTGTGVDGNAYVYYLGHPSENVTQQLAIKQNHAKRLVVQTRADLVYTLNIHVLEYQPVGGPLQPMPLTVEDAQRMAAEASSLWEQVGVRFILAPLGPAITTTKATEWNLPSDDVFASIVPVTTKRRANGIDVFVVNSIGIGGNNYLAGKTAINLHVGWGRTGIVIARRKTSPTSELEDVSELARTMAHEIFHLLNNSATNDHDPRAWNLVRGGDNPGGSINADLTTVDARDGLWLFPSKANLDEEQPR